MNPVIKWPGGKSREISTIEPIIPKYKRYIEPFFGGGALFFHLNPRESAINDISQSLIEFYRLLKEKDNQLYNFLICYSDSFQNLLNICTNDYHDILSVYRKIEKGGNTTEKGIREILIGLSDKIILGCDKLILDKKAFSDTIIKMVSDKIKRTIRNNNKKPLSSEDLRNNLITGFTSGYYMYFRKVYNDLNLNKIDIPSVQYKVANFYFIREYCYGSMFRYNSNGEFNIPYGGISYNNKNFKNKVKKMFNPEIQTIFKNTTIHCSDFSDFLEKVKPTSKDFIFLDPPYDTNFSDYEGKDFTKNDQARLAYELKKTPAKFILIIKNTDFIHSLYCNDFNILMFDNQYAYNVRSRNERNVEHLIITNFTIQQ